jgi:hypothetical protein
VSINTIYCHTRDFFAFPMIIVCCVNSKDVRLPVQLQRAMAAEAEAAREARAKVCSTKHNAIIFILSEI